MATNKSCRKDEFDWSSYKKAPRKLAPPVEAALLQGHLRPILEYVRSQSEVRLDIRPGKANLYYDGGSLLRLEGGARSPFRGVFDLGYVGEKGRDVRILDGAAAVKSVVDGFAQRRRQMWDHRHSGSGRDERRHEQAIARANDARSLADAGDFVIVDIEYCYARRNFDLVGFDRAGSPRPRLIYCELKCRGAALNGTSGLRDHGIDFGDFLCADDGRHVENSKRELAAMIQQKMRLGLLSADLGFEGFSSEPPEFLVVFADYDVCRPQLRTPLERLRTEVEKRLGGLELIRFADFPEADDGASPLLRLRRETVMDSTQFDAYRERAL